MNEVTLPSFAHLFIGTDNHGSIKSHRGLALQCLPGSTVLCIQNPDVDLDFLSPEKEREKLQLTNIKVNLHVSFESDLSGNF